MNFRLPILISLVATLVLAACGHVARKSEPVEDRAVRRWTQIAEGKADLAYDLLSPGYRATKARDQYFREQSLKPVRVSKAEFVGKDCADAQTCKVRVNLTFKVRMPVPRVGDLESRQVVTENWLLVDGQWYFVPESQR